MKEKINPFAKFGIILILFLAILGVAVSLTSSEVDMLCNTSDSYLYRNATTWECGTVNPANTSGLVPYTGATQNIDLDNNKLYVGVSGGTHQSENVLIRNTQTSPYGRLRVQDSSDSDYVSLDAGFGLIFNRGTSYINNVNTGGEILVRTSDTSAYDTNNVGFLAGGITDFYTNDVHINQLTPDATGTLTVNGNVVSDEYRVPDDIKFGFNGVRNGNTLPLMLGQYTDLFMFATPLKLEVWYNSTTGWVDETSSYTTELKELFDAKGGTSLDFYYQWQKVRITVDIGSSFTYDRGGLLEVQFLQSGSNSLIPNYDLAIELAKDTAFTNTYEIHHVETFINDYFDFGGYSPTGEDYEHRFIHYPEENNQGRRYIRFTFDFNITENSVNPFWEYLPGSGNYQAASLDNIRMLHSRLDRGYFLNRPYYWNEKGYIGVLDSTPDYPLDVMGAESGISIYAQYDISAEDVIDRTQVNTGDALSIFKDGSTLLNNYGEIDHTLFPECLKTWTTQEPIYEEDPETEFNGVIGYTTINHSGWSTSCEKSLYRQALSQINSAVDIVNTTTGVMLDADIISAETIYTESKVPQPNINYMDKFDIGVIDKKATHYAIEFNVKGEDRLNMEDRIVALEGAIAQLSTELCSVGKNKYTWCGR